MDVSRDDEAFIRPLLQAERLQHALARKIGAPEVIGRVRQGDDAAGTWMTQPPAIEVLPLPIVDVPKLPIDRVQV
jgi:hypothetical protein